MKKIYGVCLFLIFSHIIHAEDWGIWKMSTAKRQVALTFDDGPKPVITEAILKILRAYQMKATFFVVGKQAVQYPELILQIDKEGHELANHSYTHPCLTNLSTENITLEIKKTNDILEKLTKKCPMFFRPPGGNINANILNIVQNLGMKTAFWSLNAQDYFHPNVIRQLSPEIPNSKLGETLEDSIAFFLKPGSIVLLHNGDAGTVAVLPNLLKRIQEMGFHSVTLKELANDELSNIKY